MARGRTKKERLWDKQNGCCFYCGKRLHYRDADTDHVQPKSCGGHNGLENRILCCIAINRWFANMPKKKKLKLVERWRKDCFHKMVSKKDVSNKQIDARL